MEGIPDPYNPEPVATSTRGWMVIFTDLVSLMLTFFVLLFSMSHVQVDKWDDMIDALSQTLNPSREKTTTTVSAQYNISTVFRKRAINLDYLTAVLGETIAQEPVLAKSQLVLGDDRLIIVVPGDLLFEPGRAVLSQRARDALFHLGGVLRNVGNQIGINGHTDPRPPSGGAHASNWELSLARSVAVANTLRRTGYPYDIMTLGHADTFYARLPELPVEQRQALARRVDIVIFPTVGD
jgi:chemotaxis protein MotB